VSAPTPLAKAVVVHTRILAALCRRWFAHRSGGDGIDRCAAVRTGGVLVIVANGYLADRIQGELQRAALISFVQDDAPRQERASAE
jgi:hypothetical protein